MEESDLQLVLACRRGDQLAWERLIRRYQRLIYAIPLRAGLDEEDAGEIFQEVFTALFEKLNDIEQPEKLHAWLVTTARRKTLHAISKALLRKQSDWDTDEDLHPARSIRDVTPLPDEQLLILEEQHRIRTALSLLDERCRSLLEMLFYREPMSYAEIADAFGIPEGSIGPTRARCLAKVLRLLKK